MLEEDRSHPDNENGDHIQDIAIGDFNIHHPQWGGRDTRAENRSEQLLELVDQFSLQQHVPVGSHTYQSDIHDTCQTLNLCFTTEDLADRLTKCIVRRDLDYDSDHYPVTTTLNIAIADAEPRRPYKWKNANHDRITEKFRESTQDLQWEEHSPSSPGAIDEATNKLVHAIDQPIAASVPRADIAQISKPGFDEKCKKAVQETQRRRRLLQQTQAANAPPRFIEEARQRYRKASSIKKKLIKRTLRQAHRDKVGEAHVDMGKVFKLSKSTRSRGNPYKAYTPTLVDQDRNMVTDKAAKAALLAKRFFPKPLEADLADIEGYAYPEPVEFEKLATHDIQRAINDVSNNKAPGDDEIENRVIALLIRITNLLDMLKQLFQASLDHGYCPQRFRRPVTVCLRKLGKGDYSIPKSYRPIALLSTIGKALESILANRLAWAAETHGLLPNLHLGGRRGISSEAAVHVLVELIHKAWAQGKVATCKLMDVSGAFDNVSHPRLHHNLQKRRIGGNYLAWFECFVKDRKTKLRVPDHLTDYIPTDTGIPQRSPLSPILYLFYNADLLEALTDETLDSVATGYIDDVGVTITDVRPEENNRKLAILNGRAMDWARKHSSIFEFDKYQLVHFQGPLHTGDKGPDLHLLGFDKPLMLLRTASTWA